MEFTQVVNGRYSCKKYSDKPIDDALIEQILLAGRAAPTAKNLQEQKVYVVRSKPMLELLDTQTRCRYNAPVVLVVAYNSENVFTYPGGKKNSGAEDATIVATHMILAAYNAGVDSCWVNVFDPDELKKALGLPENEEILMLMDLGYGTDDAGPLPNHSSRKDLSETVKYL